VRRRHLWKPDTDDERVRAEMSTAGLPRDSRVRGLVSFKIKRGMSERFPQYSDVQLYDQLRYYSYLFNAEKAVKASLGTAKYGEWHDECVVYVLDMSADEVRALTQINRAFLQTMTESVEKYLDKSGRRWVDLRGVFSFMTI
jgi:DNA Polymerase alpha zinc finger